ncbi:MAG: hypothetical protein V3V37_10375 [Candidatus Adiutricales bacterium]|jgi:crotonobetainyl-CoA:carnitine CoA-transferase CaiB-like acyl-CoA transferase
MLEGQSIDISMLDSILAANDSTLQKYIFSDGKDDIPTLVFRPPPLLGQHSREVLKDLLGIPDNEIETLFREGIIFQADSVS